MNSHNYIWVICSIILMGGLLSGCNRGDLSDTPSHSYLTEETMTITYSSISTSMPTSEVIPVQATVNERPIEDNVYFEVVSKDYADHILTFTLKNVGYRTLPYGHPYRVDEKVDGSWHELDLGIAHTLELLEWNPSAEKEIRLNLSLWKPSHKAKEFRMRIPLSIKEGVDVAIPFTREDLRQGSSR